MTQTPAQVRDGLTRAMRPDLVGPRHGLVAEEEYATERLPTKGRAPKPSFHISGRAIRNRHDSSHEFIEERNCEVHIAVRGAVDHSFPD